MIADQTRRIVATTSARSARFGPDAEPRLLTIAWTPMVKTHGPRRRKTTGSLQSLRRPATTEGISTDTVCKLQARLTPAR